MTINLYEQDYGTWLEEQIIALKNHDAIALDWENLLEEIEDLGNSNIDAIESLLTRLYEHVLKIVYWHSERDRCLNGWKVEINAFRGAINRKLKRQPKLKRHLNEFDAECWSNAIKTLDGLIALPHSLPPTQLVTWDNALTDNWYPNYD